MARRGPAMGFFFLDDFTNFDDKEEFWALRIDGRSNVS